MAPTQFRSILYGFAFACFGAGAVAEEVPTTESIIESLGQVPVLGRLDWEDNVDAAWISKCAEQIRPKLENL